MRKRQVAKVVKIFFPENPARQQVTAWAKHGNSYSSVAMEANRALGPIIDTLYPAGGV